MQGQSLGVLVCIASFVLQNAVQIFFLFFTVELYLRGIFGRVPLWVTTKWL